MDNGPEFTSRLLAQWAYCHGVVLDSTRSDKPRDNAVTQAFNNRFRQECLNEHWFLSLEDAQEKIDTGAVVFLVALHAMEYFIVIKK